MLLKRIDSIQRHLKQFIQQHFKVDPPSLTVETPPRIELGDLAFPFPFELAKVLCKTPRQIAQEVENHIDLPPHLDRLEAAGAGYVNVFFKRVTFFQDLYGWLDQPSPTLPGGKVIVEHTNINPNKAAHIGHLRNATLGDTLVRLLRASGHRVEVQNYIDNTGVQVADVLVAFQHLRKLSLPEVKSIKEPFDYYCWDLYSEVSEWYAADKSRLRYRDQVLKKIEKGHGLTAELAELISMRIVHAHVKTMLRIGVRYDVLPRESEILQLKFWEEAFAQLKKHKAITHVKEGPNQGCWVMRLAGENDDIVEEKIIVRSNGTITYVGKDIAYQLWKLGLLKKKFHYRPFYQYPDGETVWVTATESFRDSEPTFGRGERVYNVIDVRQSYLQRVVVQGLQSLGFKEQAARSVHFAYEMVALSQSCCAELGITLSEEDRAKPYVEVSGRKGLGVKADDLIDRLVERSLQEVKARQPNHSVETQEKVATQIAVGALRYFLLKYTRNTLIAFDFSEALNFEGETGLYLQYSVVRANNIFRKWEGDTPEENHSIWKAHRKRMWENPDSIAELISDNQVWSLLLHTARIDGAIEQALHTMEITYLAKHAFTLAQQFNLFYHKYHILSEKNWLKKHFYLTITDATRRGILRTLELLGIEVPERM